MLGAGYETVCRLRGRGAWSGHRAVERGNVADGPVTYTRPERPDGVHPDSVIVTPATSATCSPRDW